MLKIPIQDSPTSAIFQYMKGTVILLLYLKIFGLSEKNANYFYLD